MHLMPGPFIWTTYFMRQRLPLIVHLFTKTSFKTGEQKLDTVSHLNCSLQVIEPEGDWWWGGWSVLSLLALLLNFLFLVVIVKNRKNRDLRSLLTAVLITITVLDILNILR